MKEVLSVRQFADRVQVDLSPDGALAAFSLTDPVRLSTGAGRMAGSELFGETGVPSGAHGTDVFVTDTRATTTRNLTVGRGSSWSPVWSPDGRSLAFLSDRDGSVGVWVWERDTDALRRLAPDTVRTFFNFEGVRWSPDGGSVLVKLAPAGMTRASLDRLLPTTVPVIARAADGGRRDTVTATVFASTTAGAKRPTASQGGVPNLDSTRSFLNAELADLAIIGVRTGAVRRIASRVRPMAYRFSPDGARVAYSVRQPDGGGGTLVYDHFDLVVVDTLGRSLVVAPRMIQGYGLEFSWSPAGTQLAFGSAGALYVVSAARGAVPHRLASGRSFAHDYRAPLWLDDETIVSASQDTLFRLAVPSGRVSVLVAVPGRRIMEMVAPADAQQLSPGRAIGLALTDPATKRWTIERVDARTGARTLVYEGDVSVGATDLPYQLDASRDGSRVLFVAESGDRPPDLWIAEDRPGRARRVSDLASDVARRALGRSRLVQWTGPNGRVLHGALLLPAGHRPGVRYPLVVKVYGGSLLSGRLNRFGLERGIDNLQLLATRGYAVLLPDVPLSVGAPMKELAASVLPGVDSVLAMGVADPARLAIMGHSYGGYSVLAIVSQTPRFRAAISSGGFSNLVSVYSAMREDGSAVGINWAERDQGRMGGSPWEQRDRYIDNSPYFVLDRVTTPLLLLHGGADRVVLPARADETFVGLRRLGKTAVLVRYEGEGHHPGTWSLANATDYWERIFTWLEQYLGPAPSGSRGQSH